MATWHTPETIRAEWSDAEQIGDALLSQLVVAARDAVIAYAPAIPAGAFEPVTLTWPKGSTATLTREGDIVTINLHTVTSQTPDVLPFPAGFGPTAYLTQAVFDGGGLILDTAGDIGLGAGMVVIENDAPSDLTFSWLADPADGDGIPDRYRVAQLMQVRNLWSAVDVKPAGDIGGETYTYQPRPLDWHVKALLRPQRGRPRVG